MKKYLLFSLVLINLASCSVLKPRYENPFRFEMADGSVIDENKFKGKVTYIEFWGTWCPPCIAALPSIETVYQRYKSNPNVAFLMVSVEEPIAEAKRYFAEKGYTLPLATDAFNMAGKFKAVGGYPTSFILDKTGKIVIVHRGFNPSVDLKWQLSREIDAQLFTRK